MIYGRAGASLANPGWLADKSRATAGARGEQATADVLNALGSTVGGPTVLHDLRIPIPGVKANIDHVVVSGHNVTVIDSKLWAPGFYWTFGERTFRGLSRFTPAEKKTIPMAVKGLQTLLRSRNVRTRYAVPLMVIWPSTTSARLRLGFLSVPGARAVTGDQFAASAAALTGAAPADPRIVNVLRPLVNN